jgi:AraC-like DNA-binding protein
MLFFDKTSKTLKWYGIGIFSIVPFLVLGQDMQELLDLTHSDSAIERVWRKDSLAYTAQDHFQLGMFEVENGNYKKALRHFNGAEILGTENGNDLELAYFMGRTEAGLGNFKKSAGHFERLLEKGVSPSILMMTPETSVHAYRQYRPLLIAYGLNFGFWDYVFLSISLLGFALSLFFILSYSKRNRHVKYIGLFTLVFSLNILEYVFYWTGYIVYSPLRGIYAVLFFLYPPLIYLYIRNNIDLGENRSVFTKRNHWHFLPFYGALALLVVYRAFPEKSTDSFFVAVPGILLNPWLKVLWAGFYLVIIFQVVKERLNSLTIGLKRWTALLTICYILLVFSYLLPNIFHSYGLLYKELEYFLSMVFTFFLLMCSIMVVVQPEVFLGSSLTKALKDTVKYRNSNLTERMAQELKEKLGYLLENEKIYKKSELSLTELADQLNIDRYSMSQVINEGFGKGFYELMNQYRIEEAKRILNHTDKNIGDVIFEVGFNNHTSFYRAFKKHTKLTPSEFVARRVVSN